MRKYNIHTFFVYTVIPTFCYATYQVLDIIGLIFGFIICLILVVAYGAIVLKELTNECKEVLYSRGERFEDQLTNKSWPEYVINMIIYLHVIGMLCLLTIPFLRLKIITSPLDHSVRSTKITNFPNNIKLLPESLREEIEGDLLELKSYLISKGYSKRQINRILFKQKAVILFYAYLQKIKNYFSPEKQTQTEE